MAMLTGMIGSLAAFYHDDLDLEDPEQRRLAAIRLIAKVPTIAAACYRYSIGWPVRYPRNNLEYCTRFLHMMFEVPSRAAGTAAGCREGAGPALHPARRSRAERLDLDRAPGRFHRRQSLRLRRRRHRRAVGTGAWRRQRGGAEDAGRRSERPTRWARRSSVAKDKNSGFRLMGFGHRVYKNFDPRATIIREMTHKVLGELGVHDPLLDVAMKLEDAALKDDYFIQRKLYPNVDFYSGIIYKALKIPTEMFTVMFAIARTAGWVAHWLEQQKDPDAKIGRPRQIYTGATPRDYLHIGKRG
jgi:citrate synthase